MLDTIKGPVTKVIDGDTFEMKVTHLGQNNKFPYGKTEKVRIANKDAPEIGSPSGRRSKSELERRLKGRKVRCYIQSRDVYGRIIAKIELVN
jgi:endonuclease YncB( thermonuclease family)